MLRPRHTILGLALLVAMLGNSWGQSQQPSPSGGKGVQPPYTQPHEPTQTPKTDQRGTEQAPVVVKILPATEGEKQAAANAKREEQKSGE
jgi:hypothetical protein